MSNTVKSIAVSILITIAIAANALIAVWSQKRSYEGMPLDPSVEPLFVWTLVGLALIAVVAVVGPRNQRIWLIVLLAFLVTVGGSFFVSQIVLSIDAYRRDYTSLPIDALAASVNA